MKYAGTIMIVDDDGEVAYERELTADEMIEELVRKPEVSGPEEAPAIKLPPKPEKKKARKCGRCGKPGHIARHCPDDKPAEEPGAESDERQPMTKGDFLKAKERYDAGIPGGDIADELGLAFEEVKIAIESSQYMTYIKNRKQRA